MEKVTKSAPEVNVGLQPIATSPSKSFKPMLLIIGLVIVIGLLSTYSVLSSRQTQPSSPPVPQTRTIPPADPTAGWKDFTSDKCGFGLKYPQNWVAKQGSAPSSSNPTPSFVQGEYQIECAYLTGPNYKSGLDTRSGEWMSISRTKKGSSFKSVAVNNLEDFVKSVEAVAEPAQPVKNKRTKVIGDKKGLLFDSAGYEIATEFVFEVENYIYDVWLPANNESYWNDVENIIGSIKFSGQTKIANQERYFSSKLGISFLYLTKQGNETIVVKEVDSRIYVYSDRFPYTQGQYVEVFQKNKTQTLREAIEKKFLNGYSPQDCFVSTNVGDSVHYTENFELEEIRTPPSDDLTILMKNAEKCPVNYTTTNGVAYFLQDKNHADKFVFFSIGQYPISADTNKSWQDTIQLE